MLVKCLQVIAPLQQATSQAPQPLQRAGLIVALATPGETSAIVMALNGHTASQRPHPRHLDSSTMLTAACPSRKSLERMVMALAAAPEA